MTDVRSCDFCNAQACSLDEKDKYPSYCPSENMSEEDIEDVLKTFEEDDFLRRLMQVSSQVEGRNYLKMTRVEETIDFIKRMDFKKVGIASCISFLPEARLFGKVLKAHDIEYRTICCKVGAIDKGEVGILDEDRIRPENDHESMCNPILQSKYLEKEGCDFNIAMGLCVGHDVILNKYSKAPLTTLITKDRVTCHSPAAPLHYLDGIYSKILEK